MIFRVLLLVTLLIASNTNAIELKCDFEEVYKTGEVQRGFFLIKDNNLRYEYFEKSLFKIFYVNEEIYIVENKDKSKQQQIDKNNTVIEHLMSITYDFPDIQDHYAFNDVQVSIEKNIADGFVKRISFKSNKLNMSLYLLNCNFQPINGLFFKIDPVFEYLK